ncbi:F-box domain-containing protein [Mycena chlorophos]|uniref:F-box domain-containing protein n=1 Tax=Mycena chlorophos TaxID=658473 RepID=A0A8H6S1B0_MYCCL|nr:F-box domain-containing protein [Mycena chlorophos]
MTRFRPRSPLSPTSTMGAAVASGEFSLDDDILYRIFLFLPDFKTLDCATLTCKKWYQVYTAHPKTITRSVGCVLVGGSTALSAALRFLRYPYPKFVKMGRAENDLDTEEEEARLARSNFRAVVALDPAELATACPEPVFSEIEITQKEKERLEEVAKKMHRLEDVYSLTTKNRMSKTSLLTPLESSRFQAAAYRVALFCDIFDTRHAGWEDVWLDYDDIVTMPDVRRIREQRTAVMNVYPTDGLQAMHSLVCFMAKVLDRIATEETTPSIRSELDLFLSCGPLSVLDSWTERSIDPPRDQISEILVGYDPVELFLGYLELPMHKIAETRNVPWPPVSTESLPDAAAVEGILDEVVGAEDTCSQCSAPGGLRLLTEANWDRLDLVPRDLLRGKLPLNAAITGPSSAWHRTIQEVRERDGLGAWVAGLWDHTDAEDATWSGWERHMSYCEPCLRRFLEAHVWRWWLSTWKKTGWSPPAENCWYGYDCTTQTHALAHAEKLNHLCVPTRQ